MTREEAQKRDEADALASGADQKAAPFDVEAAAEVLLAVIGPNDPFIDKSLLKVYPCN